MNFVRFASYELDPSIRVNTDFSCSFPLQVRTNGVPLWTFFEEKKYYLYRIEYLCSENYRVEEVLELKVREILSFHEVRFASRSKSKLTLKRKIPSGGGISKDSHARLISWRKNVDCAKLRVGNRSVRGGRTRYEKSCDSLMINAVWRVIRHGRSMKQDHKEENIENESSHDTVPLDMQPDVQLAAIGLESHVL